MKKCIFEHCQKCILLNKHNKPCYKYLKLNSKYDSLDIQCSDYTTRKDKE